MFAWLIERGQPEGMAGTVWWCGAPNTFSGRIADAVKLATEADAERVIDEMGLDARPVCHAWSDT